MILLLLLFPPSKARDNHDDLSLSKFNDSNDTDEPNPAFHNSMRLINYFLVRTLKQNSIGSSDHDNNEGTNNSQLIFTHVLLRTSVCLNSVPDNGDVATSFDFFFVKFISMASTDDNPPEIIDTTITF